MNARLRVVVPMRPLGGALSGLEAARPEQRRPLALWMLRMVLRTAVNLRAGPVLVLGGDGPTAIATSGLGALWRAAVPPDPAGALAAAAAAAAGETLAGLLLLRADAPLLGIADLAALVAAFDGHTAVTAGPGDGRTAALLAPPNAVSERASAAGWPDAVLTTFADLGRPVRPLPPRPHLRPVEHPTDLAWLETQVPNLWLRVAGAAARLARWGASA